mmetsp:Transcript_21588/g.45237  ORF Transcript_21588/g.45237 Transcript_21588/m.45237 type:complete len:129 (-) Transcript_21588:792-1178(-)
MDDSASTPATALPASGDSVTSKRIHFTGGHESNSFSITGAQQQPSHVAALFPTNATQRAHRLAVVNPYLPQRPWSPLAEFVFPSYNEVFPSLNNTNIPTPPTPRQTPRPTTAAACHSMPTNPSTCVSS